MNRSVNIAYDGGLVDDYLSGVAPAVWQIMYVIFCLFYRLANSSN